MLEGLRTYSALWILWLVVSTCGCAWLTERAAGPGADPLDLEVPFEVEISKELNDGKDLYIQGRIAARTTWPVSDISVCVSSMRFGESVGKVCRSLEELLLPGGTAGLQTRTLEPGQPAHFTVRVPLEAATDYQLDLLWGREASGSRILGVEQQPVSLKGLVFEKRLRCGKGPCLVFYSITGELVNEGGLDLVEVVLGVRFDWYTGTGEAEAENADAANEDELLVTGLALAPSERQSFRLDLDQAVPEREDGEWRPVLRVISYRFIEVR